LVQYVVDDLLAKNFGLKTLEKFALENVTAHPHAVRTHRIAAVKVQFTSTLTAILI
jgi:hypothetical protein